MGIIIDGYVGRAATAHKEMEFVLSFMPKTGKVIEIGTLDGVTVAWWATQRPDLEFITVDPFKRGMGTGPGDKANYNANKKPNQRLIEGDMYKAVLELEPNSIDRIHVDGDHSYQACIEDLKNCLKLIKPNGIISVHDYNRLNHHLLKGVTKAVDDFCKENSYEITSVVGYVAKLEKI